MYAWLISLRYLRSRKILFFPIGGVAIGILVLIVVSSVMNGFARDMRERIRGTLSDLIIRRYGGYIEDWKDLTAELEKMDGVTAAAPHYEWYAAVSLNKGIIRNRGQGKVFIGIVPEKEVRVTRLGEYMIPGAKRLGGRPDVRQRANFLYPDGRTPEHPGAIVGAETFYGLENNEDFVEGDSTLTLISARLDEAEGNAIKSFQSEFTIVGRFHSGMAEYDAGMIYIPLEAAQRFMQPAPGGKFYDVVTDLNVKIRDYAQCEALRDRIQKFLNADGRWGSLDVRTWEEEKIILLRAVEIEKKIMAVIMFFIVIVAGFNIAAILNFMVEAKTRDIGILKALGATRAGISRVFLANGILIGMIGALAGIAGGLVVAHNLNDIEQGIYRLTKWYGQKILGNASAEGWRLFDPNVYYLDHVPVEVSYAAVLTIVVAALVVSLACSLYPAWRAARLDPIETIRYEA